MIARLDYSRGADPCCYACHGSGWDDADGPNRAGVCGCVDMSTVRAAPEKRSGVEQFDAPIPDKPHVSVKQDDGTTLILSWEEARRAHDAFDRAVLERDLRRNPLGKK